MALDEMTSSTLRVSLMAGAAWHTTNRKATRHRFDHQIFFAFFAMAEQREEKRFGHFYLSTLPSIPQLLDFCCAYHVYASVHAHARWWRRKFGPQ